VAGLGREVVSAGIASGLPTATDVAASATDAAAISAGGHCDMVATLEHGRRLSTGKRLAILVCSLVVLFVVVGWAVSRGGTTAGTLSAKACLDVVDAGREAAVGSRSLASFLSVVKSAESDARAAADMNERYRPILTAIVEMRDALEGAGETGPPSRYLAS
jgi:hypothetical protein